MRKPIRLKDIAKEAGVHEATVSAVLSESSLSGTRVSPETAERIRRIAKEQNYRPNRHAQIIRRRRSGIIGIVEFGLSEIAIARSYHLAKHFFQEGVEFLAQNAKWFNESAGKAIYQLLDARVEGIVLVMPNRAIPDDVIQEIYRQGVPVIAYNGNPFEAFPHVRSNVEQSMQDMVCHLIGLGYKDLALLSRWPNADRTTKSSWAIHERLSGFERTIVQSGGTLYEGNTNLPLDGLRGRIRMTNAEQLANNYYEDGFLAAIEVLQWDQRPDALVCTNDQFAIGVMQACRKFAIKVPEELAVVGFGNLEVSRYVEVPLTTVDTRPQPDEGKVIFDLMRKMIEQKPLDEGETLLRLPSPLVIRKSCGTDFRSQK